MSMNSTPSSERLHIGIFGERNVGKSSLINALTGQNLAIVSPVKGTTTDPVRKAMELLPLGPVVLIDTPGVDDQGELGQQRVKKSYQTLNSCDLAILVSVLGKELSPGELRLLESIQEKNIPCMLALSQSDRMQNEERDAWQERIARQFPQLPVLAVSAVTGYQIEEMKEVIGKRMFKEREEKRLVADLLVPGTFTLLVVPLDQAAPKGRLILPQQQTIRDILEAGGIAIVVRDEELEETLRRLDGQVGLVITDSQVFEKVGKIVPDTIPLTSFSILFARYKGELNVLLEGTKKIRSLEDGDSILICEGCTHHRQCNDIGTVKIPGWLQQQTGKNLKFSFASGGDFPEDISGYRLIIHCGGCMLREREMKYRIACAKDAGVSITNYGMTISELKGILERSVRPLKKDREEKGKSE